MTFFDILSFQKSYTLPNIKVRSNLLSRAKIIPIKFSSLHLFFVLLFEHTPSTTLLKKQSSLYSSHHKPRFHQPSRKVVTDFAWFIVCRELPFFKDCRTTFISSNFYFIALLLAAVRPILLWKTSPRCKYFKSTPTSRFVNSVKLSPCLKRLE